MQGLGTALFREVEKDSPHRIMLGTAAESRAVAFYDGLNPSSKELRKGNSCDTMNYLWNNGVDKIYPCV
jgi:hypothetical protein